MHRHGRVRASPAGSRRARDRTADATNVLEPIERLLGRSPRAERELANGLDLVMGRSMPPTCIGLRPTRGVAGERTRRACALAASPSGSTRQPIWASSIAWPERNACRCSMTVRRPNRVGARPARRTRSWRIRRSSLHVGSRPTRWKPGANSCGCCGCRLRRTPARPTRRGRPDRCANSSAPSSIARS